MDNRNSEDGKAPVAGWEAGKTFFAESGGEPAIAADDGGADRNEANSNDANLPASEAGTGMIPEDTGGSVDVHQPASEQGAGFEEDDGAGEPQSWPGRSFGSIPPPG